MSEVKPTYITFEQAKWLKSLGFDYHKLFQKFAEYYDCIDPSVQGRLHESDFQADSFPDDYWIPVPEQHQVVEWLLDKHNFWISIRPPRPRKLELWGYYMTEGDDEDVLLHENRGYKTPQEAYSAAFDYIKNNNLIY